MARAERLVVGYGGVAPGVRERGKLPNPPNGYVLRRASNANILVLLDPGGSEVAHFAPEKVKAEWIEARAWKDAGASLHASLEGSKRREGEVLNIADYADEKMVVDGWVFYCCDVQGPAVLIPGDNTIIHRYRFQGARTEEDLDKFYWEVPDDKVEVVGAILARNCLFEKCEFINIGLATKAEWMDRLKGPPIYED
jgi:hypothetical protein